MSNFKRTTGEAAKRKLSLLKDLQGESLEFKIQFSKDIIRKALAEGPGIIFYSGGKDSSVLLSLVHSIDNSVPVMYNNTTLCHPTLLQRIRDYTKNLDYIETIPERKPEDLWKETGYYPLLSKRGFSAYKKRIPNLRIQPVACCYHLKEIPSMKIIKERKIKVLFWGNRAEESNRRKWSFIDNGFLFQRRGNKKFYCYPIQHWTERDIYNYLGKYVPEYKITDNSFESGCIPCGNDITFFPNNLSRLYLSDREVWEFYMLQIGFGEQILRIKGINPEKLEEIIRTKPSILLKV